MWSFYANYLFIEFTENVLYRDIYRYRDMNDLYRDMIFWSYRPALRSTATMTKILQSQIILKSYDKHVTDRRQNTLQGPH